MMQSQISSDDAKVRGDCQWRSSFGGDHSGLVNVGVIETKMMDGYAPCRTFQMLLHVRVPGVIEVGLVE